ncbi:MAG: hypothetical protein LCH92_06055 [Proteobacteria bacterium]|nr:hypothetical protein [Pseudomonadota bacterium]
MRAVIQFRGFRGGVAALCVATALASCENAGTLAGGGAESDYLVARQALETGNYDIAIRTYGRLMGRVDASAAARLQLEYAHALLRGNRFDEAVAATDPLIARHEGAIRLSALAVRGTARHEEARRQIDGGRGTAATRTLLMAAQADLTATLQAPEPLDSTGSMRARLDLIAADLARLG